MRSERSGARAESFRSTEENKLSTWALRRSTRCGNARRISAHTPCKCHVFSASRGNRDLRSEVLADVDMIALAVELRVGQHPPDAGLFAGGFNDSRQILVIVERAQPHVGPTAGLWLPASAFCQDYACAVESSVWRTRPVGSRPTLTEVGMFVGRFLDKERKLVCSRACLLEDLIAWFARITFVKRLGFSAAVPLG